MEKQRWEESEKRREEERRSEKRKSQKKEMICGSGGSKSRLAKAAGAEPSGQMRDEKLHAVVARSTFRSQNVKTPGVRTTFGSWDVEKVHAVVARSTFRSQNVQNTQPRSTFGSWDVEKVHAVVARSTFRSQNVQNTHVRTTFGRWDVVCTPLRGRRKGFCTLRGRRKVSKTWGFCSMSKNDGRRGTFEEDLQRCISRGKRSTRDMFIRDVRRSGRWFPERGCILEHQIFSFAKMILRDRCSTSYDLASLFRGRRSTLDRWSGKIAKRIGTRPSALHSTFHFWRKSRRIASFLMLSTSKIEEVSQNCFVFDVVKFKNWGSLAELLRFWCCQVQKLRRSRRIASFSSRLQIDRQVDSRYTTTTTQQLQQLLLLLLLLLHRHYTHYHNNNYYYTTTFHYTTTASTTLLPLYTTLLTLHYYHYYYY